jgi:hypothetical protein
MRCLNEQKLKMFLQGMLTAEEMIAAGEHVHSCAACRAKIATMPAYHAASWTVGQTAMAINDCPEYEELSDFVDNVLAHEAHQRVNQHLNVCELCWRDVETLQAARSRASLAPAMTVHPGHFAPRKSWTNFGWQKIAALSSTATAVAIAAVFLLNSNPSGVGGNGQIAAIKKPINMVQSPAVEHGKPEAPSEVIIPGKGSNTKTPVTGISTNDREKPSNHMQPPTTSVPKREYVAMLKDGTVTVSRTGRKIAITSDGRNLEARLAVLLKQKLRDGKLPPSVQMASLPSEDRLRDLGPRDIINVQKSSPAPGAILEEMPEFQWASVEGATKYRVEVYKLDGTSVIQAETDETSYRHDENIPAGIYKWVVRVRRGVIAGWEWSNASAFRVLSPKEAELLATARHKYSDSHLIMGTVYESLGLTKDAAKEFQTLMNENPNSALAKKLLANIGSSLK